MSYHDLDDEGGEPMTFARLTADDDNTAPPATTTTAPNSSKDLVNRCTRSRLASACAVVVLIACVITLIAAASSSDDGNSPSGASLGDCALFCTGDILRTVQLTPLYNSSKTFVDLPAQADVLQITRAFGSMKTPRSARALHEFVGAFFGSVGSDVEVWTPGDFKEDPPLLGKVNDTSLRQWAKELNALWPELGRSVAADVALQPDRHSLIPVAYHMIVPGGRFNEVYYWDTYWIVRGLLACGMTETATGIVENLLQFVQTYGFVPNGNRQYYLSRSQPPFLTQMVNEVYAATHDMAYLQRVLPILEKEYAFWMKGPHVSKTSPFLNRYYCSINHPRPESYLEDVQLADEAGLTGDARLEMYNQVCAGAETGWDYSSRWFHNRVNMSTIVTMDIVPADLNAVMYRNEETLSTLFALVGNTAKSQLYKQAAENRGVAINSNLWDSSLNQWVDFNEALNQKGPKGVASNFIPLWAGLEPVAPTTVDQVVTALVHDSGLWFDGGVSTSAVEFANGQQWDYPNAWAPVQHMIIEGLDGTGAASAKQAAAQLAQRWVSSNYMGWTTYGAMFEKYDARHPGSPGGGGEYHIQKGFGWTNGVVLALLDKYGATLHAP